LKKKARPTVKREDCFWYGHELPGYVECCILHARECDENTPKTCDDYDNENKMAERLKESEAEDV